MKTEAEKLRYVARQIARLEAELIERDQEIEALEEYIARLESEPVHVMLVDLGFAGDN